jgi:hypothetical protein
MNLKKLTCLITSVIAIAGFQTPAHASLINLGKLFGPPPIQLDAAPTPEKSVSLDSFKQLKDCKKAVITSFNVQFITKKNASASAGRESEGAAHINSNIKLLGLDNTIFQSITDQAYTNFVKGLTALGVEVQPYSTYMALPEYTDMKSYLKTSPLEVQGGMFSGGPVFSVRTDWHAHLALR